ncbi:MAG: SUMF1/EgtB/PvdO family nonheme iron enzyme, partial [Planctomycetales bacterium]|nr:SUMF1/EgtB/PvdO family nonheme iron enzyme [Planctomycetales bacterium]
LDEARTVANLDHPHIVPIYYVGATNHVPFYMVTKFIPGLSLEETIEQERYTVSDVVDLTTALASALQHAHDQGVIHRDVKPANVLIDQQRHPHLVDFGLALRDQHHSVNTRLAGTPAYMSPEQVRAEGHRIDHRTDIFSLGVILYELLSGHRPFSGDTLSELFDQILHASPIALRQRDPRIPAELERICLRALEKRALDRYATATELAEDLAGFRHDSQSFDGTLLRSSTQSLGTGNSTHQSFDTHTITNSIAPPPVVPKGLRPFDQHDASFFLRLLPGPRDRDGLPASVRFWKARCEDMSPDAIPIGLLYGPPGSGKSSFIRAGLVPRLARDVHTVLVEATANTEEPLNSALRRRFPHLPDSLALFERIAELRRGVGLASRTKVLIVIDQFEQWLQAHSDLESATLVRALRQCDGSRVQCLLLVRDDFWLETSRLFQQLELPLAEGHNSVVIDQFDRRHARQVLIDFGRAYMQLPPDGEALTRDHEGFLDAAIDGLAVNDHVICVHLAFVAEMMKDKPWTERTFRELGGSSGLGVTYLEEIFSGSTASPNHRQHEQAARRMLAALIPDGTVTLKGPSRSYDELKLITGCPGGSAQFDRLLQLLDAELRLISPVGKLDEEIHESDSPSAVPSEARYQLAHDYLVAPIRTWLQLRQRATRGGRAQLCLADRAALWTARPENRRLPSWTEFLAIRCFTRPQHWRAVERRMMRAANWWYASRTAIAAVLLVATIGAGAVGWRQVETRHRQDAAQSLIQRFEVADTAQVPQLIVESQPYRTWFEPLATAKAHELPVDSPARLHLSLALLSSNPQQLAYIRDRLLDIPPDKIVVLRPLLVPFAHELCDSMWAKALNGQLPPRHRADAACYLAGLDDPDDPRWAQCVPDLARHLVQRVQRNAAEFNPLAELLEPVRQHFTPAFAAAHREAEASEGGRLVATQWLAHSARDNTALLVDALATADDAQLAVLLRPLGDDQANSASAIQQSLETLRQSIDEPVITPAQEVAMANQLLALHGVGSPDGLWRQLENDAYPGTTTELIHRMKLHGITPSDLLKAYSRHEATAFRYNILMSLGTYPWLEQSDYVRDRTSNLAWSVNTDSANMTLRSAAHWLLTQCDRNRTDSPGDPAAAAVATGSTPGAYTGPHGHTMIVIPGGTAMFGAPYAAAEKLDEAYHQRELSHTFAMATCEVTRRQFEQFLSAHHLKQTPDVLQYSPQESGPAVAVTWIQAAAYCNWLSGQAEIGEDQLCYDVTWENEKPVTARTIGDHRQKIGFRLPDEVEWEYGCRSGAPTDYSFGNSPRWLKSFAWYADNSPGVASPVAERMPNRLGLFDMHGNAAEWCHNAYVSDYTQVLRQPTGSPAEVVVRGGAFSFQASNLRSSQRQRKQPEMRLYNVGFRIAQTVIP